MAKTLKQKAPFSRATLWGFVVLFAAVGSYAIWRSLAAPTPPTVYLSPSTLTLAANSSFSVQVRENSGATAVNAVQANFSYNSSLVTFVSIDATNSAFPVEAQSTGGSGSVNIARGITGSVTGDQLVATVNFTTGATGGSVTMSFTSGTALASASSNQDILGGLSATGSGTYNIDTTAPTVSVSSPANGATISAPGTTSISVNATDAGTVASVDLYIDGVKKTTLTASPYTYSWNTTGLSLGSHTIQAKATDGVGNLGTSATNTVTLADQTAPTVSLSGVTGGTTVNGTKSLTSTATDNTGGSGIAKVEFYVDGALKSTDTSSPFAYSWDTTTATNASHSLTAKAYDNASPANIATSSAISVTVDNSLPATPGSFTSSNKTLTSITLSWTASTDNIGVTGYRITRNGTTITTTGSAATSYADSGLSPTTTYAYTIVALDGVGNASTAASLNVATLTAKTGDLNGDNNINITDLSILLSNWNSTSGGVADINASGKVDIFDLSILLSHWGT